MYAAGHTAVGLIRNHNEDSIFYTLEPIGPLPNLFIVADGMGGHNAGEVASQKSIEFSCSFVRGAPGTSCTPDGTLDLLVKATAYANKSVNEHAANNPDTAGMGTTFTACTVLGDVLAVSHVGDSRIYTISAGEITQITNDHSYVEEMVAAGHLTPEQAKTHPKRNQLTRSLGFERQVSVDGKLYSLSGVDSLLMCTDGLNNMLSNEEILTIASQNTPLCDRTKVLIDAANNHGGTDNISVIIIDVKKDIETADGESRC